MNTVLVGQVTTRKGARFHASVERRAYCGAGNGRIIAGTEKALVAKRTAGDPTSISPDGACRRCRKHLLALADEAERYQRGRTSTGYSQARVNAAHELWVALQTPAERAADEAARVAFRAKFDEIGAANRFHAVALAAAQDDAEALPFAA